MLLNIDFINYYKMSSNNVNWKTFNEPNIPKRCRAIISIIVVLIFVGCIIGLIVWDGPNSNSNSNEKTIENLGTVENEKTEKSDTSDLENSETKTIDQFSFSQRAVAQKGKPSQSEVKVTNGSIIGDVRQIFIVPPTTSSSQVIINNNSLYYEYKGNQANGFEVRWLDYVTRESSSVQSINLENVNFFDVDVEDLNLGPETTFTIQMNIKDAEGIESSVVGIIDSPGLVRFRKSSFLGDGPNQKPDFTKITGIWFGGDFRRGGGTIKTSNLEFSK